MEAFSEREVDQLRDARAWARWILGQREELERRYQRLRRLLTEKSDGNPEVLDVDELDLELARADLEALLKTACPDEDEDDDECIGRGREAR